MVAAKQQNCRPCDCTAFDWCLLWVPVHWQATRSLIANAPNPMSCARNGSGTRGRCEREWKRTFAGSGGVRLRRARGGLDHDRVKSELVTRKRSEACYGEFQLSRTSLVLT